MGACHSSSAVTFRCEVQGLAEEEKIPNKKDYFHQRGYETHILIVLILNHVREKKWN